VLSLICLGLVTALEPSRRYDAPDVTGSSGQPG
jgi:hypothetical protein